MLLHKSNLFYFLCSPIKGGVDAKELFHLYILVWIQDKRLSLLESCKLDKVVIFNTLLSSVVNCLIATGLLKCSALPGEMVRS